MLEETLKDITELYWLETQNKPSIDENLKKYICADTNGGVSLLKAELDYARESKNIHSNSSENLVLLVGLSIEPLLQSICVYEPENVILILNQEGYPVLYDRGNRYGTEEADIFAKHIIKAVGLLAKESFISNNPNIHCHPSKDDEIFKTLVKTVHDKNDVVVDITGGKKSMVTGAFLYAAFAGARISYVDFDKYSVKNRRPYGFSCKIGELSNPYLEFSLREWENVRIHYNKYHFNEALQLLKKDIRSPMIRNLPYSEEAIDNLIGFIEFYNKWDSGDFCSAKKKVDKLRKNIEIDGDMKFPSVLEVLGDTGSWYKIDSNHSYIPPPIYGDLNKLLPYVLDELARVERLIKYNEDYRSAFLQAGGVNEMIMLGRLLNLVRETEERNFLLNKLKVKTPRAKEVFDVLLQDGTKTVGPGGNLTIPGWKKNEGRKLIKFDIYKTNKWWEGFFMNMQKRGCEFEHEIFLDMRNEVAHKHFPVSKEWADEGLKFVRANLEDFLNNHLHNIELGDYCTKTLPWSELCNLCGMKTFLTPNLRRDE